MSNVPHSSDSRIPADTRADWQSLALVVAGAALLAGIGEASLILLARVVLDRYTLLNPQAIWLNPVVYMAAFAVPIAIAWVLGWRTGGPTRALRWSVFIGATLAILAVFTVVKDRLHVLALTAVAVGLSARVAAFVASDPQRFKRWAPRGVSALAMLSLVGAMGFNGSRAWRERMGAPLGSAGVEAPNVILLVLDTVRALSLSAYGYHRPTTPFLASLAREGVLFERAMAPAPWTLPSHATMFTGRYPHELSASWSVPLDDTHPTLAEQLTAAGYRTGGFAANLRYCSYEFGLSRGFGTYRDYDVSVSEALRSAGLIRESVMFVAARTGRNPGLGRQPAARVFDRFLDWLGNPKESGRPYFAFLNVYDAHAPYAPPAPWDTLYLGRHTQVRDPDDEAVSPEELGDLQATYDASITWLDTQVRTLFDELERRGALDNTLVIVTSDHGEEFREHGLLNHGSSLYLPSVHVPLIMVHRGRTGRGQRVGDIVSLRDIPSTILTAVGAAPSLPGVPLLTADGQPTSQHSEVINELDFARNLPGHLPVARGDMKAVFEGPLRYILNGDRTGELYDVIADPAERQELSGSPASASARDSLRRRAESIPPRARR